MKIYVSLILKIIQRTHFGRAVFKSFLIRTNSYFDWYIGTKEILYYLNYLKINKNQRILLFGCGNSSYLKRDVFRIIMTWIYTYYQY
jgi:hypothetical protein